MGQGVTMMQTPRVHTGDDPSRSADLEIDIDVELVDLDGASASDAMTQTDLEIEAILEELSEVHDVQRTDRYRCVPTMRRHRRDI